MHTCLTCGTELLVSGRKYCSNRCQSRDRYIQYITEWKLGQKTGNRGINTQNISAHIKRYLSEKFGQQCAVCGWSQINPVTGVVPLEIDHIDGNADNNHEDNLRLICPNCHSLSPNFRNLNKGRGRAWRSKRYLRGKDKQEVQGPNP